jgi:MtrB/PioB family decaheme-associated outer membrane protein
MKRLAIVSTLLLAAVTTPAQEGSSVQVSGTVSTAGRGVDNDTNSSKLTEYRDLEDDAYLPTLRLNVFDPAKGWYFDFTGANVSLSDRKIDARGGRYGTWRLAVDWSDIPHNFSNKAETPYLRSAPGLFEVPATVPITFKKLATAVADTPGVLASDALIAAYQGAFLAPTPLALQSRFGRIALEYEGLSDLRLAVAYDRRRKDGLKSTFGPIGDRPPRTLNIQFTEPVDYTTQDLTLSAEWTGSKYQAQFSYLFSDFANGIDTLSWENVYATAAPGATTDTWDRAVSVFGRRPLAPDNRYHNVSVGFGAELPADSRLSATFAYGRLEQNQSLLPYSFNSDMLANPALPRATADARMNTQYAQLDYAVSPVSRVNVRAWARYSGLDNETPSARWQYVTSDTANLNGSVTYLNKRVSVPYAQDRKTAGLETTYRLSGWSSNLALGYERELVDREHREANTAEDRVSLSWRARPAKWAKLRYRYVYAKRDGDYDPFVTREGYWYSPSEAGDNNNNPQFTFDNHPDMVRFDVADRKRNQAELALTLTSRDVLSLTLRVRNTEDDFDSEVRPIQPLASTGVGEVSARTPGSQLGLLKRRQLRYALDAFYLPAERVSLNAFMSWDRGKSLQSSLEFNENNKANPSAIATAELGPWTRASSRWTADFKDRTWTAGVGTSLRLGSKASASASYTLSLGDVDLAYAGFGVTNWDGAPFADNHQFQFPAAPEPIFHDLHVVDVRLEFPLVRDVRCVVGYGYERYRIDDWMQGTDYSWAETVGSEFLIRDSSRSFQWGNRLFNLGSYLAPRYDAHIAWIGFTYRF